MESKNIDYCNSALKVLSAILDDGKKTFTFEEGEQMAGIYWRPIVREMVLTISSVFRDTPPEGICLI